MSIDKYKQKFKKILWVDSNMKNNNNYKENCKISFIKGFFSILIILLIATSCNSDFSELLNDKNKNNPKNNIKNIISFQFLAIENSSIPYDINGTIIDQNIIIAVPHSTNLNLLIPSINFTGGTVYPGSGTRISFSENTAKTFTVTALDNSSIDYNVVVSREDLIGEISIPPQDPEPIYEISDDFSTGIELYTDENYTINSEVPVFLKDNNYVKPANMDRNKTDDNYITISITEKSTIYVAYDITYLYSLPDWLNTWEYKYVSFTSTNGKTYYVYAKEFNAGEVTLGANWASGATKTIFSPYPDQYIVVVRSKVNRTFVKGINFNGSGLIIEGENWISQADAELDGFSTDASNTYDASSLDPSPATDADTAAMLRKSIYESAIPIPSVSFQINQILENGDYEMKKDDQRKRYVHHRAWIKTDANGQYTFYTFMPGKYLRSKELKQIHRVIKEPGKPEYTIKSFFFNDDPLLPELTLACRAKAVGSMLRLEKKDSMYVATKDIKLNKSIVLVQ